MSDIEPAPRRLHPATLISRSFQILPQMLAGGAGYAAIIQREGFGRILLFAIFAAGLGFAGALLSWWRFRYTIGAAEIVIESGVLHRKRRVIPFDRVQDIAIDRPLHVAEPRPAVYNGLKNDRVATAADPNLVTIDTKVLGKAHRLGTAGPEDFCRCHEQSPE